MVLGEEREVRKEGDVGGQPPQTAGGGVDKEEQRGTNEMRGGVKNSKDEQVGSE